MEKSYAKLLTRIEHAAEANAVSTAVDSLRRHSSRNVICSLCENDRQRGFKVTDVDSDTGSISEVQCKRCKETSYVCHGRCYFQRSSTPTGFESSYKEQLQERKILHSRKSIRICNVMDATATLLRRRTKGNICSCGNNDPNQLKVIGVDRLRFITSVECSVCQKALAFSPLEASYVVQMLYHRQSDQEAADVLQKVLKGDHVKHIDDVSSLLRRHSFYEDSICPEFDSNDKECCRVTAIDKTSGKVMEVEFDFGNGSFQKAHHLQITCRRSGCYYDQYKSPSQYESTYKAAVRAHLQTRKTKREGLINKSRRPIKEAILSCTVLAANATILRRHNIDNKLCIRCKNDNDGSLKVIEIDEYGFITRVQCTDCGQLMKTTCHNSRMQYEEIDGSETLERGDHISWHRTLAYWHHAVVTDTNDKTVTIAHYEPNVLSVTFQKSTRNRQDIPTSFLRGIPYRITYHDCYTNEYSALRAEQFVGKKRFHPSSRNCEQSSNWCRTGLSDNDQMMTCFSSVGKTLLAFCLRILNMLLLMLFQVIQIDRENIQIDRKAFDFYQHIFIGSYMAIVFVLFFVWCMHIECKKLKPTGAYKCCCSRPRGVACGLVVRIIVREVCAASGPFLLIFWFEYYISHMATRTRMVIASFLLLSVTIVSYVLGAVLGSLLEYVIKLCRSKRSKNEQTGGHSEGELTSYKQSLETNDLNVPSTSLVRR